MSGEFVAAREDVLGLYAEPYDPKRPKVNFDETSKQLIGEVRTPLPAQSGHAARYDYEYKRNGTRNLFLFVEPQTGWRHVTVTQRRTRKDYAECLRALVDVYYPSATKIRLVQDNRNTHDGASLYEAFAPAEARRLVERLELHYTPKHGSWLNIAEIELSTMSGQCLNRRIPDRETLEREVAAWEAERNALGGTVNWRFTTEDARAKLKRLYPSIGT